jgi:hypothetical protein
VLGGTPLLGSTASDGLPAHATSAEAILPLSAAQLAAPPRVAAHSLFSGPHAPLLQAMAAVLLLAVAAAWLVHMRLMRQEQRRRQKAQGAAGMLELLNRQRRAQAEAMRKVSPAPGSAASADGSGKSAPETPEQLYTPQQDRRGSRELPEVLPARGRLGSPCHACKHIDSLSWADEGCMHAAAWCRGNMRPAAYHKGESAGARLVSRVLLARRMARRMERGALRPVGAR